MMESFEILLKDGGILIAHNGDIIDKMQEIDKL